MSRIIKASLYFCDWNCQNTETRRFPFEEANFASLQQKLVDVFQIRSEDTTVAWIDSDGDRITICSDEELGDALNNVQGPVLKLLVKTNKPSQKSSCPWAWICQYGHDAHDTHEGDDAAGDDEGHEHHDDDAHPCDPHHSWGGHGCPLGFMRGGGQGNWGSHCPLRNATCPMGFGGHHCPMGFGQRPSSMGFGGPMRFGRFGYPMGFGGHHSCPMGFGSGSACPMKGYAMSGGLGCPMGFKHGESGCPLRKYSCPMKAGHCCPMGFKCGGSGCPLRKYKCPMGFGQGKHSGKKEEPQATSGEV